MKQDEKDIILQKIAEGKATQEELEMADLMMDEMEQRLSTQIDKWEESEKPSIHHAHVVWMRRVATAAACLILIFSVTYFAGHYHQDTLAVEETQKDTFDNPEEAAKETEKALLKFSETINKAICYNTQ